MSATKEDSKSLVLVVGAGASKEVNLPVGAKLKREIASVLDIRFRSGYPRTGDDYITEAFRLLAASPDGGSGDINPLLEASWLIRDAMPQAISIDNFIDSHRDNERIAHCGKLAIARCILAAEANSSLSFDQSNSYNKMDFGALEATWFNAFFQLLTESCQPKDLESRLQKIGIISFNYDRCVEHCLYFALQNYYRLKPEEAAQALSVLEIYHPYGTVGMLPWMAKSASSIEFGATPVAKKLIDAATQIKTFTEGTDASASDILAIRELIAKAERVAFLGFAFHRQNLELLFSDPKQNAPRQRPVYATFFGISMSDAIVIVDSLAALGGLKFPETIPRIGLTCHELFREYRRSLSLC